MIFSFRGMSVLQKANLVAQLIESYFHVDDGSIDQAEYLLTINDLEDVREWLTDAFGLDDSHASQIDSFLKEFRLLKDSYQPRALVRPQTTSSSITVVSPRTVLKEDQNHSASVSVSPIRPKIPINIVVPPPRTLNRRKCYCLAKVEIGGHPLIGNCLNCGRIVCDSEDYGPCLSCGEASTKIHWLVTVCESNDTSEALKHKDRLIQYDREGTRRTKIYDDSTDWFAEVSDVWKGKEERESALKHARDFEEQKLIAKQQMKVEIDFSTGQIKVKDKASEIASVEKYRDEKLADWIEHTNTQTSTIDEPEILHGNVLDRDSQEILSLIRAKLGKAPEIKTETDPPVSIFSFLDEVELDSYINFRKFFNVHHQEFQFCKLHNLYMNYIFGNIRPVYMGGAS